MFDSSFIRFYNIEQISLILLYIIEIPSCFSKPFTNKLTEVSVNYEEIDRLFLLTSINFFFFYSRPPPFFEI